MLEEKESTPRRERNATHRNTEKLYTQPSSLRGEIATGEIHCEPENAFGNEAQACGELYGAASSAAPQPPCLRAGQRAGEPAHPGARGGSESPWP